MTKSGIQGLAAARSDLFRIDPTLIVVKEAWNARDFSDPENMRHVETLAESIREVGVLEPLTVFMEDGQPVLTNGESRLRAVRLLLEQGVEIKTVPVQTEPRHASEADRFASQITRNSGKPFTVLEQSQVFGRLVGFGWAERDIAARGGITIERVRQIMSLNQAPETTKKLIRSGKVSATVVQRIVAKAKDGAEIDSKVKAAVERATAEGKAKAGPRHVEKTKKKPVPKKPKVDHKGLLAELVAATDVPQGTYGEDELVYDLVVSAELWARVQEALK
jgi:ParB-like chromosome segregation protein Spo0J